MRKVRAEEVEAHFWAKVDVRGEDDCWEWQAGKNQRGYGFIRRNIYGTSAAHRFALASHQGIEPPPTDVFALHSCDNPGCVNPSHLRWGSNQDNCKDRSERNPGYSKWVEDEDAIHLVRRCLAGESAYAVGKATGISRTAICNWLKGKSRPEILARARELAGQEPQTEQLSLF